MHSKIDNKEIMINNKMVEVIEKVLNHSLVDIKIIWKHREFAFDYVHLMCYKCHKI